MAIHIGELGKDYLRLLEPIQPKADSQARSVSEDLLPQLLDMGLERGYLTALGDQVVFQDPPSGVRPTSWLQITRLPIHPGRSDTYDLLSRWQSVLAALHSWNHQLLFLLLRDRGETRLYLGTPKVDPEQDTLETSDQIRQAAQGGMPGIELTTVTSQSGIDAILTPMMDLSVVGSITGIPSLRRGPGIGVVQTLDQLAFGLRDRFDEDVSYAVLVIADPINDQAISRAIQSYRRLGSQIHSAVRTTISEGSSHSRGTSGGAQWAAILGTLVSLAAGNIIPLNLMGFQASRSESFSTTSSSSCEYLDKFAEYAEQLTDRHIERLKRGRNLGFWNVGTYVLGRHDLEVTTVCGMLRSIYSGDESFIEPIRSHLLRADSNVLNSLRRFQLVRLPKCASTNVPAGNDGHVQWNHPFGNLFGGVSTPLNTEELSISTSLPRRDVHGLRFVRTSVRFATNPPVSNQGDRGIVLGKMMDTGVPQTVDYEMDHNALVRHAIICGTTGSGKSTTCRRIVEEVRRRGVPVLIIEPAKDDYVRWAIRQNREVQGEERIRVYMPGARELDGTPLDTLALNPFEPACAPGSRVDLLTRCECLTTILNASLPMTDVLPLLIDEAVYRYIGSVFENFDSNDLLPPPDKYPKFEGLIQIAKQIISERRYEKRIQDDLIAAVETRLKFLTRGKRGAIINVEKSTDFNELFNHTAVVNLSRISSPRDKAFLISLIALALREFRVSLFANNSSYRAEAVANRLKHLAVIEEAHHLLAIPPVDFGRVGNPQQVAADMFSEMLSEIRGYGQGVIIVDQVPSKLIPDAIKNTNYKIVHRLPPRSDREIVASCMALREDQQEIIASLPVGEAIVCGDLDDAASWVQVSE